MKDSDSPDFFSFESELSIMNQKKQIPVINKVSVV